MAEQDPIREAIRRALDATEAVDQEYKSKVFQEVLKYCLRNQARGTVLGVRGSERSEPLDFIRKTRFEKHSDRVIAMGYYLDHFRGEESFNARDIEALYKECRIRPPKNVTDVLNKQMEKDLLMVTGEKGGLKGFQLTVKGLDYVESAHREQELTQV